MYRIILVCLVVYFTSTVCGDESLEVPPHHLRRIRCPEVLQGDMVKACDSNADCGVDEQCCFGTEHVKYCTSSVGLDIEMTNQLMSAASAGGEKVEIEYK